MGWIIAIVIGILILGIFGEIGFKIMLGLVVVAIGFLLLNIATDFDVFIVLANSCGIIIIVAIVICVLIAIFSSGD